MPNKVLMIGGSIGVAALLLLLAVLAGGPGAGHDDAPAVPVDPDLFLGSPEDGEQLPLGEAEGLVYEIKESGILFFANRVVPKPQGAIDVIETTIQIHLAPGRELTIDADEGTIIAPDNHPREGEMRGHVIVTLYETPDGSQVDMHSDRHVVTRMFFDDPVQFDLELQQIDSEGPIFMTGPQVQFRGRGLSLNFNQLRHRIERLVIEEGQSLHYIPKPVPLVASPATASQTTGPRRRSPGAVPDATTGDQPAQTDTAETDATATPAETQTPEPAGRPIQYYLATFEELNDVRVGQDQYVIKGDGLSAIFSAKAAGEIEKPDAPDNPGAPATTPATSPDSTNTRTPDRSLSLASSDPMSEALLYALSAAIGQVPDEDPRSLATFTDEDVVITWSGRLTVLPLNEAPESLAGPDDVMVTVKGKPASIVTDKGETVRAPKVSFLSLHAGLLAEGTSESPVTVDAPDLGSLTGTELSIDQALGTGYVLGPGQLTGLIREKGGSTSDATQPATDSPTPNPQSPTPNTRPITVAFDDRLNLAFYLKQSQAPVDTARPPTGDSRIKGVKSADFFGNVRVEYDELDMTADRLTLTMLEEAPQGAKAGTPEADDKLAVESLSAIGNVKANVKREDVKVFADRLFADPAKDQLELFGSPDKHAQVVRPDATLAGEHLVMDEKGGTVNVPGPGSFDFLPEPENPGKTVHITWATRMHYDDLAGKANFQGDVKTLSTDGTDTNELMGDDLVLTFVKDESADVKSDSTSGRAGGRRLATAVMNSNVRFRARSYATAERNDLQTELFLIGPRMEFNDPGLSAPVGSAEALQQVQVIGTGRMLITDTRPQDEAEATAKPEGGSSIDIAGRGRTAFEWSDRLILDLTHGQMLMKGAVAMVHRPESGAPGNQVQLDCQDLAAELKKSGDKKKSSGWLSEDAPKPELNRVWADGGIRILHGPATVTCDHLLYEENKREIILWSDEPNVVTFEAEGEPTPAKSSAFKWHRDTGRVEAFKLRTGTIPLRRSEGED